MKKTAFGLVVLLVALVGTEPLAFAQFSGYYKLIAHHSGKAAVVSGASTANSAAVIQYTYSGTGNDEWELVSIGSGYYKVLARHSGKAMVVASASTVDSATVVQYTYGGTATNDEWQPVDLGNGYFKILNRNGGKALTVQSASTANNAQIIQYTFGGANANDEWQIATAGGGSPTPTPTPSGGCARTVNVSSSSSLSSAASGAQPGDCIVVADGTYGGFAVTADGTSSSPISIKAANRGMATISSGTIYLNGAKYVTVEGFKITTPGGSLSVDSTTRKAAVFVINTNDSRLTRCTLRLSGQASSTHWVYLGGNSNRNRIDRNEFGPGNSASGYYIYPSGNSVISGVTAPAKGTTTYESWANGASPVNPNMARNTQIDHNYFHDKLAGTGETMTLGGIGVTGDYQDLYTVVEYNLFVSCDGDAEMIASKSSSNTIRLNTIRTSVGMISLRAGNKSKIQDNMQLQAGKTGSAGIKIYEHDHTITGNYIDNPTDYPLLIGAGDSYLDTAFAHAACRNCVMDGNTAINLGVRGAIVGHGGSGVAPSGCTFRNNQLRGTITLITLSDAGDTDVSGNTTSGSNPAQPRSALTTSDVGPNAP